MLPLRLTCELSSWKRVDFLSHNPGRLRNYIPQQLGAGAAHVGAGAGAAQVGAQQLGATLQPPHPPQPPQGRWQHERTRQHRVRWQQERRLLQQLLQQLRRLLQQLRK
ncbi:MAG TPA: hypothetical protein VHB77_01200 [Planctomycetaceae bacterium]|nr:hypothetical protein [Planctomycetaceae bacterium]